MDQHLLTVSCGVGPLALNLLGITCVKWGKLKSSRFRKITAAAGVTAAAVMMSIAGTSSASAVVIHKEEILTAEVCVIRGNGMVANGTAIGFTCNPKREPVWVLTWW